MFLQEVLYVLYVPFQNKNTVSDRATSTKFRQFLLIWMRRKRNKPPNLDNDYLATDRYSVLTVQLIG